MMTYGQGGRNKSVAFDTAPAARDTAIVTGRSGRAETNRMAS